MTEADAAVAVMPQLRGLDLTAYTCEFCPGRRFQSEQTRHDHQATRHREDIRSREIQDAISGALSQSGTSQTALLGALVELVKTMSANQTPPAVETSEVIDAESVEKRGPGRPRKEEALVSAERAEA